MDKDAMMMRLSEIEEANADIYRLSVILRLCGWSMINLSDNERYCGDVFTRKTYTQDVLTHRKLKNRGQRPHSRYLDTHEAIISRDDFIAVQHRLNNARFGSKSILPELMVIPQGLLRGFVIVNPRWGAFQAQDYRDASMSAYMNGEDNAELDSKYRSSAEKPPRNQAVKLSIYQ